MGQAWCKEKTSKAQDSKSPLDRVFVRCAHRIYPGLKEEGSVLGGATQRVTSSEIGYAGSPPREVLARGRSIDSVDRPFHPSDWVDVNLEVPSTPRGSPVLANLTIDTSLRPTSNHPTDSNSKSATPVPPPRRRKKNKGRPLPPKPDEGTENCSSNSKRTETNEEPLYSSVRSPKNSGDEQEEEIGKQRCSNENAARDARRTKEIYEHKVNGTGRIISSDVVSGKRTSRTEEKKSQRAFESNHLRRSIPENDEYERFASNRTSKDSSTPNREDKRKSKGESERQIKESRAKNYSTVSLPNYDELDAARHRTMEIEEGDKGKKKPRRPVRSSTGSLPAASFLSPFSEKTSVRLEDYIPSQGSPDNLSAYQLLQKLNCGEEHAFVKYETASKSQDWDFGDVGNCELNHHEPPSPFEVILGVEDENIREEVDEDVVDFSRDSERKSPNHLNVSNSTIYSQKAEAFGKTSPVLGELEYSEADPNRSQTRHFNPPTLVDSCRASLADNSSVSKEPFFLDEKKHLSVLDAIGGSRRNDEPSRSRTIFTRSLSIESEPNEDTCETKDLRTGLIRSISEESLPKEMLEEQRLDQLFDEKLAKDVHNKLKKSLDWKTKTPPPSPEPKSKSEAMDLDHSTLLKVLKEEAAEESNLSSMTPSLTELEAALSDMLEKEECQDGGFIDEGKATEKNLAESVTRTNQSSVQESKGKNDPPVSLGQILKERKAATARKVSFCSWEEALAQSESRSDWEFTERPVDLDKRTVSHPNEDPSDSIGDGVVCPMDLPPEKPSRLNRSLDDANVETPTPPKRRNRSLQLAKKDTLVEENGSVYFNDRLI